MISRITAVVFLAFVLLSQSVFAQPNMQEEMARMNAINKMNECDTKLAGYQSQRQACIDKRLQATYLMMDCIDLGATPAQIDGGQSHFTDGNADLALAEWDKEDGDPYKEDADDFMTEANQLWDQGIYWTARLKYNAAAGSYGIATSNYNAALMKLGWAMDNFTGAQMYYLMLRMQLEL